MKRDSHVWWFVIASAVLTAVSSRMDLLDAILPTGHTDKTHALIELASLLIATVGGVLRASPLMGISDEGKRKYHVKKAKKDAAKMATKFPSEPL